LTPIYLSTASPEGSPALSQQLALTLAQAADDRKGGDILVLDVQEVSYLSDYFVIVTGFSRTQVRAIADAMQKAATEVGLSWIMETSLPIS
jgi:ribosome-associated protein